MQIKNKRYIGYICKNDKDPKNLGRYQVYIPELIHTDGIETYSKYGEVDFKNGIWCKNRTVSNKMTHRVINTYRNTYEFNTSPRPAGDNYGDFSENFYSWTRRISYSGAYYPLMSGTLVTVLFKDNDYNKGLIIETIADTNLHHSLLFNEILGSAQDAHNKSIKDQFNEIDNLPIDNQSWAVNELAPFISLSSDRVFTNKGNDTSRSNSPPSRSLIELGDGHVGVDYHLYPLPHNLDRDHIYIPHSTPLYNHTIQSFENIKEQIIPINVLSVKHIITENKISEYYTADLFLAENDEGDHSQNTNFNNEQTRIYKTFEKLRYYILAIPENTMRISQGHGYNSIDFHQFRPYNNSNFVENNNSSFFHPELVASKYLIEPDEYPRLPINDNNNQYYYQPEDSGIMHIFSEGDLDLDVCNRIFIDCMSYIRTRVGKKIFFDIGDMRTRSTGINSSYSEYSDAINNQRKDFMVIVKDDRPCEILLLSECLGGTIEEDVDTRPTKAKTILNTICDGYPNPDTGIIEGANAETIIRTISSGVKNVAKFKQEIHATGSNGDEIYSQSSIRDVSVLTSSSGANALDKLSITAEGNESGIELENNVVVLGKESTIKTTSNITSQEKESNIEIENNIKCISDESSIIITDTDLLDGDNSAYEKISNTISTGINNSTSINTNITCTGDNNSINNITTYKCEGISSPFIQHNIFETQANNSSLFEVDSWSTNGDGSSLVYNNTIKTSGSDSPLTYENTTETIGASSSLTYNNTIKTSGAGSDISDITTKISDNGGMSGGEILSTPNGDQTKVLQQSGLNLNNSEFIDSTNYSKSSIKNSSGSSSDLDETTGGTATKTIKVTSGGKSMTIQFDSNGDLNLELSEGNSIKLLNDGKVISTTGSGATITLDGATATIDASGGISLEGDVSIVGSTNIVGNTTIVGNTSVVGNIHATGNITAPNINEI